MSDVLEKITIVLISHKSKNKVIKFIKNFSQKFKIIIVENSNDRTIDEEIKKINTSIKLIFSKNNGYGSAINLARKFITTEYFFVFNPDIVLSSDNLISDFYKSAKNLNENFGALGPRFDNVNEKSHKQSDINKKIGIIDSISGSAMFFKTQIFDINEGFDENFFLYFEETDYCRRSKKNGYKIYQINNLFVSHNVGSSVEIFSEVEKNNLKNLCIWHFIWSKYYYYKKHYGKTYTLFYFQPLLIRSLFKMLYYHSIKKEKEYKKYKYRVSGLLSAILNKKSYLRIDQIL
jgi:N-acetylglucosaminyl-diphospho-decaprenol L-rhamnosyltransferase